MTPQKCPICRDSDVKRVVELSWNAGMSFQDIARVLHETPTRLQVSKHLHEHAGPEAANRTITIENARPMRERVTDIQRLLVEEVERRIQRAEKLVALAREAGSEDAQVSDFFDILSKDMQASIASILKAQALSDTRERKEVGQKIDLFKALTAAGAPPAALIGDGMTIEGEAHEA